MPNTTKLKQYIQNINNFLEETIHEGVTKQNQETFNKLSFVFSDEYVRLQKQGMSDIELQTFLRTQVSCLDAECALYFEELKESFFNRGKVWN